MANDKHAHFSIADFVALYDANIVLVSCPENGGDPKTGKCTARVMEITEVLPQLLKEEHAGRFVSAVDFNGSTSSAFCNGLVHSTEPLITGANDFDRDLKNNPKCQAIDNAKWNANDGLLMREEAIRNSFWICFWRGSVYGALRSTLIAMGDRHIALNRWNYDYLEWDCCLPGAKSNPPGRVRAAVAVTIQGGVVSRQEKALTPGLCDDVVRDLQRRGYDWAADARIFWVHFPTVMHFLQSLSGERRLSINKGVARRCTTMFCEPDGVSDQQAFDYHMAFCDTTDAMAAPPPTYGAMLQKRMAYAESKGYAEVERGWGRLPPVSSLLKVPVEKALTSGSSGNLDSLIQALLEGDAVTVQFQIRKGANIRSLIRHDQPWVLHGVVQQGKVECLHVLMAAFKNQGENIDALIVQKDYKEPPLHMACRGKNCRNMSKALLGCVSAGAARAMLERKYNGKTPVDFALQFDRPELADMLRSYRR